MFEDVVPGGLNAVLDDARPLIVTRPLLKVRTTPTGVCVEHLRACRALYTVSIGCGKPLEHVAAGYSWARETFPETRILIGDSLFEITLGITHGMSGPVAERYSRSEMNRILRRIHHPSGRNEVIRTSDLVITQEFLRALKIIRAARISNPGFATAVEADAISFVARQERRSRLGIETSRALQLACSYIEQEVAIYLALANEGWLLDVYLGSELGALKGVIEGKIPGVARVLEKRIFIELAVRKSKQDNLP